MGTGFGYWVSLTIPVQWFPQRKGLITGIAAAGFGFGAVMLSYIAEKILLLTHDVLQLLKVIGISYGLLIILFSNLIAQNEDNKISKPAKPSDFLLMGIFRKLFLGIFLGTFAGLLIIGSLKIIGEQSNIPNHTLITGVSFFAVANFLGRLFWGFLSDLAEGGLTIFLALALQAASILALNFVVLNDVSYLVLSFFIGFGFGGNFVLFAKETAHIFGIGNLGIIYPYVFLGYAFAGIAGPLSGGLLFDWTGNYTYAVFLAGSISFIGGLLFFFHFIKTRRKKNECFE
jgi:OFA family oxalate/formate antiporter-like MFS transporter